MLLAFSNIKAKSPYNDIVLPLSEAETWVLWSGVGQVGGSVTSFIIHRYLFNILLISSVIKPLRHVHDFL